MKNRAFNALGVLVGIALLVTGAFFLSTAGGYMMLAFLLLIAVPVAQSAFSRYFIFTGAVIILLWGVWLAPLWIKLLISGLGLITFFDGSKNEKEPPVNLPNELTTNKE
jgi:hypothetical protein